MMKQIFALMLVGAFAASAQAEDTYQPLYTDLDLSIQALDDNLLLADNRAPSSASSVPNVPDSAFTKPAITANNVHMYLGLASLAFGGLTAISAPEGYDPDLLNTVHYKAAKLSWQLGAAAIGTGLWTHWDDFHLEDGLLDRDNLHVILGTLGVIGYYLAVKSAVDEYNNNGYPSSDHSSAGVFGGAAMLTAITLTW
jgi:hypothetical protein